MRAMSSYFFVSGVLSHNSIKTTEFLTYVRTI